MIALLNVPRCCYFLSSLQILTQLCDRNRQQQQTQWVMGGPSHDCLLGTECSPTRTLQVSWKRCILSMDTMLLWDCPIAAADFEDARTCERMLVSTCDFPVLDIKALGIISRSWISKTWLSFPGLGFPGPGQFLKFRFKG